MKSRTNFSLLEVIHKEESSDIKKVKEWKAPIVGAWEVQELINMSDGTILRTAQNGAEVRLRWVQEGKHLRLDRFSANKIYTHTIGQLHIEPLTQFDMLVIGPMEEYWIESNTCASVRALLKQGITPPKKRQCLWRSNLLEEMIRIWSEKYPIKYNPLDRLMNSTITLSDGSILETTSVESIKVKDVIIVDSPFLDENNKWSFTGKLERGTGKYGYPHYVTHHRLVPCEVVVDAKDAPQPLRRGEINRLKTEPIKEIIFNGFKLLVQFDKTSQLYIGKIEGKKNIIFKGKTRSEVDNAFRDSIKFFTSSRRK